jgi:iron(III) transport system substrate-binding protein
MRQVSLLLLATVLLAGCASDDRERLVVYSPHGKELLSAYEEAFEALHPDVDVQWLDMGSQEVYDRVRTERVNPQASIWWGAPQTTFAQAARDGLLEPYTPTWTEAAPVDTRDTEHRWYGTFMTPEVIAYNTQALRPEELPRTWDDLLSERFRNRIIIRNPLGSGTMVTIFGAMIQRQPSVEEGYRWLAHLDARTRSYAANPTQLYLQLARGQGDITLWNLPDIFLQAQDVGYPFGYVIPEDGTPVLVDGIAIVAGAPNQERARQFYEFVTSQEAAVDQARRFHRIPARMDVPPDSLPDWIRQLDIHAMPMDWDRLAAESPTWMRYWDERIKGRGAAYLKQ